ncbi:class I SAM-dependent methyltransferase [Gracilibacillus alcaliphilus]|uniref:class I SAM-dependent methyltransferase n=1 Tax=Gracilibacillus alcaliphilus TaxID=1401441 RepID=UPI0019575922|nr:methyltransferase domain-containing protein [Gracilibacillus alcaliphilus]MBM7677873.1 SAM-dependent methyltransferase [Gracilibacillus alcaliphilus]
MNEQSRINKKAWEYRAYEFWCMKDGMPSEKAKKIMANPKQSLKKHQTYFKNIEHKRIANLCGSNGRRAVPLALLGADVTVFDISEENKRYALELADCANTSIHYIVGDIQDINLGIYSNYFDMLYLEGGILHYFNDLESFIYILFSLLKNNGTMILSDFHPVKRCIGPDLTFVPQYFDQQLTSGDVAYKSYFPDQEQSDFPEVAVTSHTLSQIINTVIQSGFQLNRLDEHRGWNNENFPWEFTIVAKKI